MTDVLAQVAVFAVLVGVLVVLVQGKWWFVNWLRRHPRFPDDER